MKERNLKTFFGLDLARRNHMIKKLILCHLPDYLDAQMKKVFSVVKVKC